MAKSLGIDLIEYVIPQNPDDRALKRACNFLEKDGIVIFPTDTNWIMAVRYDSKKAIDKLYRLKGENRTHHFSLLCSSLSMATSVAVITDASFRHIKPLIPGHYTFILEAQHRTTKLLQASKSDKQVGIRFPPAKLALTLIEELGMPLLSTNLTNEMLGLSADLVPYGQLIDEQFGHAVDMIIDPGEYEFCGGSTVISLLSDEPEVLRQGAGQLW